MPTDGAPAQPVTSARIDLLRRFRALFLAVGVLAATVACSDDEQPKVNPTAAVYQAILVQMVDEHGTTTSAQTTGTDGGTVGTDDGSRLLPVFVEPLGDGYVIDLTVQAGVIRGMKDVADVRFIDQRAEAVDDAVAGEPVRDGGMLVALGPLLEGSDGTRRVQVRRYVDADRSEDRLAVVTESEGSWSVALS